VTDIAGRSDHAVVRAFWCRTPSRPNFGDALTPWIIRRVSGSHPRFTWPADPREKHLVTGSIVSLAGAACTVWGSGIMDRGDRVSTLATLVAVRGPLTWRRAVECGCRSPQVIGDPALLLPRLHTPPAVERRGVGVLPHFADAAHVHATWRSDPDLRLLDVQEPVEEVIAALTSCDVVASSSLHGLIASHAYGIPTAWITFGALPSGDGSKFRDYLLSAGCPDVAPLHVDARHLDPRRLRQAAFLPDMRLDVEALWQSCPFGAAR
jgi:hypothetical protein